MRLTLPLLLAFTAHAALAQQIAPQLPAPQLPDAPSFALLASTEPAPELNGASAISSSLPQPSDFDFTLYPAGYQPPASTPTDAQAAQAARQSDRPPGSTTVPLDANGNPIPLSRQQPKRILGFMPNFRSVSAGAAVHPPGWKYNFKIATRQAFDYSSFIFLGLTTVSAYATDAHPSLDKGDAPFWAYLWRGFLDKTDGTLLGGFFYPSLLHEDNRYYPLGDGHSIFKRSIYVIDRQVITRNYSGNQTFNIANLAGKATTQYVSRFYYPANSSGFSVLATKFAYSAMRDIGFSAIREFYPDVAAHYIRKHREKVALESGRDTAPILPAQPQPPPSQP